MPVPIQPRPTEHPGATLSALLARVAEGDRAAFGQIYQLTSAKLFGVTLRICWDRTQAEEALQETYLTVWRRAASFDAARGSAMTWLQTVARNQAVDHLRRARLPGPFPLDAAADAPDPAPLASTLLEQAVEERRMLECMDTLDAHDAGLVRAGFLEGSTYSELATRTETPLGTIKSRIRRALLKLRACLE